MKDTFSKQVIIKAGLASTKDQVKLLNSVGYFDKFNQLLNKIKKLYNSRRKNG